MSHLWSRRPSPALVISLTALVVAVSSGAYAASKFVGGNGTIHGCVNRHGALTVVKPGTRCPRGESSIAWNQTGPQGPKGDSGNAGPPGPTARGFDNAPESITLPSDNSDATVSTTTLQMSFAGTVLATDSISFENQSSSAVQAPCHLRLDGANVAFNTSEVAPLLPGQVVVVGAADNVSAGSHTVSVVCHTGTLNTSLGILAAHLIATAIGS
jgi:hypothetical protein